MQGIRLYGSLKNNACMYVHFTLKTLKLIETLGPLALECKKQSSSTDQCVIKLTLSQNKTLLTLFYNAITSYKMHYLPHIQYQHRR